MSASSVAQRAHVKSCRDRVGVVRVQAEVEVEAALEPKQPKPNMPGTHEVDAWRLDQPATC